MIALMSAAVGASSKSGNVRAIRYTPGGDHRRRVDQGGHGRGALHRVRQPGVERQLGGLGERADEQQQAGRHDRARRSARTPPARARTRPRYSSCAGLVQDQEGGDHEADVADHVHHERLDAGVGGGGAPVPERDQQVGRGADERPADDQQDEVARQDEQQHREDEVVEVGEEAGEAVVAAHVGDRVDVDQERHAAHHEAHEHRQRVDEDRRCRRRSRRSPRRSRGCRRRGAPPRAGPGSRTSAPIEARNDPRIAPLAIQPAVLPGSTRQPSEITSRPASGKASTSQP